MEIEPSFLFGKVAHTRIFPAKNSFSYHIFYLAFALKDMAKMNRGPLLGAERSSLMSFWQKDHLENYDHGESPSLQKWMKKTLSQYNIELGNDDKIILIAMPRVLGYVFNPVSFWFCYGANGILKAILVEVRNTFCESHNYLCIIDKDDVLDKDTWFEASKVFFVSPFLPREGSYKFRFQIAPHKISIQIDYYDAHGHKQLITSLQGRLTPISAKSWFKAFFGYPLITIRAVYLIHWQAVKLWWKKQNYYHKPLQNKEILTFLKKCINDKTTL